MNKKSQAQFIPAIIIIILVLYFLNQSLNPKIAEIKINNNICNQLNLNVEKGTTIKWTNSGIQQVQLDLTSITKPSIIATLPQGATYSLRFDNPGTYPYICSGNQANIIVR